MKLQFAAFEIIIAGSLLIFTTAFSINTAYQYSIEFTDSQFNSSNFIYDFVIMLQDNKSVLNCMLNNCSAANNIFRNFAYQYKLNSAELSMNNHFYFYSTNSFIYKICKTSNFCFPVIQNKSYEISCISTCS